MGVGLFSKLNTKAFPWSPKNPSFMKSTQQDFLNSSLAMKNEFLNLQEIEDIEQY